MTGFWGDDVDLSTLGEELFADGGTDAGADTGSSDKYSLDGLFSAFKKGLDQQVESGDTETHFNLGIAYKEMGLYDDAIGEFEQASHDPQRIADSLTLQAMCYREKGDAVKAEDSLITLESDKATMDVPSPAAGTVKGAAGDQVKAPLLPLRIFRLRDAALRQFVSDIKASLAAAQKLGSKTVIVTTGSEDKNIPRSEQHAHYVSALKAVAPFAEQARVTIVLEPLNTKVDHPGYYLQTAREGFEILDEVGSPAVKMLFDMYHHQIMEGNVIQDVTIVYRASHGAVDQVRRLRVSADCLHAVFRAE